MIEPQAADRFLSAPLLSDVDNESRQALLAALVETRASAGAVLLAQGQPNDHLSFLIEGTAAVERTFPGRRKEVLAHLTAPTVFGTTSFFRAAAPTTTVRATADVRLLSLYHPAHDRLRKEHPRAAEALSLAVVRTLCERFDLLDQRISDYLAEHSDDHPKVSEWSHFRSRLFEETGS